MGTLEMNPVKPDQSIKPPTFDIVSEGGNPDDKSQEKENSTMKHIFEVVESSCLKFANWIKKSIAMMIIFVLLGAAGGIYVAKFVYDMRMSEVTKVGGFVHDKRVYDVRLRP